MKGRFNSRPSRTRVAAHRARLRDSLRPIQIWVPDVRSPEFKAEAERQARLVALDPYEAKVRAFIEAVADWDEE